MPTRSEILEDKSSTLFHAIENNDIVILPGFSSTTVSAFLQRVATTKFVFISDVTCLKDRPDESWTLLSGGDEEKFVSVTYDCAVHCLASLRGVFEGYDFVVMDHVDERILTSDYFMALLELVKNKLSSKLIVPLKSDFEAAMYEGYLKAQGHAVDTLDLVSYPEVDTYFFAATPPQHKVHTEMATTLKEILDIDEVTESYDILMLVPTASDISILTQYITNSFAQRDFSIITNLTNYTTKGSYRRVLISTDSKVFLDLHHRVKYVIDSGLVEIAKSETNGFDYMSTALISHNRVKQHTSILHLSGSKYFCMASRDELNNFHHGVHNTSLLSHMLYTMKFSKKFHELTFLQAPTSESMVSSLDEMLYLGLITLQNGQNYTPTKLAHDLCRLHIPPERHLLALAIALVRSPTLDMARLLALCLEVGTHTLSSYLKSNNFDPRLVVKDSDLLTLTNVVNCLVFNEKIDETTRQVSKNPLSRGVQARIKRRVAEIGRSVDVTKRSGSDEEIEEALAFGGQFLFGTIKNTADVLTGKVAVRVTPLRPFEDVMMEMVLRRDVLSADAFRDGDLVLIHGLSLEGNGKKQTAYIDLCSKIPKALALKVSKVIKDI